MAKFQFTTKEEEFTLAKAINKLPKDRSNLGKEASEKILFHLREGTIRANQWQAISNTEAITLAGFNTHYENLEKVKNTYSLLPYYGELLTQDVQPMHPWHRKNACEEEAQYGRIANPVVHMVLNQLRKVINEIISLYGKPQEIRIELARELGNSKKKREELLKKQQANTKANEEASKELAKYGIKVNRTNIIKYKLWKEQGYQDIFTLNPIQVSDFEACEIDHLICRGLGVDAYTNLVLLFANTNLEKGDSFPIDYIQAKHSERYSKIMEIINKSTYPKSKAWRFSEEAKAHYSAQSLEETPIEYEKEQSGSALNDTRYIARIARKYLYAICEKVQPVQGSVTAKLRHLWGLDYLEYDLMNYDIASLTNFETGETLKRAKPRLDHRHHALDAFVVANTSFSLMQRFAKANKYNNGKIYLENIGLPLGFSSVEEIRPALLKKLKEVKVSLKQEHGLNGQLHDATKYSVLCQHPQKKDLHLIYYNRPLGNIDSQKKLEELCSKAMIQFKDLPQVQNLYAKTQDIVRIIQSKYAEADQELEQEFITLVSEGAKPKEIKEKDIVQRAIRIAQKEKLIGHSYPSVDSKTLAYVHKTHRYGYEPRANLRTDFYVDKEGEIKWECISRFNANQKNFIPESQKEGNHLLCSLYIDDIFEMYADSDMIEKFQLSYEGKYLFRVQKMSKNKLGFYLLSDAHSNDTKHNSDNKARLTEQDKGLITFTKNEIRKVILSPFGKVVYKHKKLWHGKKEI